MGRAIVNRNKTGGTNPNIPQTAKVDSRGLVNRMKKGGTMKKAQTGVTTKKGRTTMNIDSSGYAAGKKAGFPAQMISPKTKYSKGDTTNVTVNRNTISKAIKKSQNGTKESKNPFVIGYQKKLERVKSEGNPNNPPLKNTYSTPSKNGPRLKYSVSADTTGLAAGKKEFPSKITNVRTGKTSEGIIGRKSVEYRMKNPNKVGFKTGGKITKKCKYGCK